MVSNFFAETGCRTQTRSSTPADDVCRIGLHILAGRKQSSRHRRVRLDPFLFRSLHLLLLFLDCFVLQRMFRRAVNRAVVLFVDDRVKTERKITEEVA